MVKNTGFLTTKGGLIRDILYPKPINYSFDADSYKMIALMVAVCVICTGCAIPFMIQNGAPWQYVVECAATLMTTAIPPALPAALSCGVFVAMTQIKRKEIYCTSPNRINLAGQVQTFIFDKTGTLTEDGLSVLGVRPTDSIRVKFQPFTKEPSSLNGYALDTNQALLVEAMAACTAIAQVN